MDHGGVIAAGQKGRSRSLPEAAGGIIRGPSPPGQGAAADLLLTEA
jgi:hypothetical protein